MNPSYKIRNLFIFVICLFLTVGIVRGIVMRGKISMVQEQVSEILDDEVPTLHTVYDIELNLAEQSQVLTALYYRPFQNDFNRLNELMSEFEVLIEQFSEMEEEWQQDLVMTEVESLWGTVSSTQSSLIEGLSNPAAVMSQELLNQYYNTALSAHKKIKTLFEDKIRSTTESELEETGEIVDQIGDTASTAIVVEMILFGLFTIFVSFYMAKRIGTPLNLLRKYMNGIESGERSPVIAGLKNDEFGAIGNSLSSMVRTLGRAEKELAKINAEQHKLLENISFGVFSLDDTYKIGPVYSAYSEQIFKNIELTGTFFPSLVFNTTEDKKLLERYLSQLKNSVHAARDMLDQLNPLKEYIYTPDDGTNTRMILAFSIFSIESGYLVIVEDRTSLVEMEEERLHDELKHEGNLEAIYQALQIGPSVILEEMLNMYNKLDKISRIIDTDAVSFSELKRVVHNVKGVAGSLSLHALSKLLHLFENTIQNVQDDHSKLADLKKEFNLLLDTIQKAMELLQGLQDRSSDSDAKDTTCAVEKQAVKRVDTARVKERYSRLVESTAEQLSKEVQFEFDLHDEVLQYSGIDDALIHLIKNALDHGIEEIYERVAYGKDNPALLSVTSSKNNGHYTIEVKDDGQGINTEHVRISGISKGLLKQDEEFKPKDMVKLLFTPGFSTVHDTNEISGRGIGLDAVKDIVFKNKGKINVQTGQGKGTVFTIKLPVLQN